MASRYQAKITWHDGSTETIGECRRERLVHSLMLKCRFKVNKKERTIRLYSVVGELPQIKVFGYGKEILLKKEEWNHVRQGWRENDRIKYGWLYFVGLLRYGVINEDIGPMPQWMRDLVTRCERKNESHTWN